MLLGQYHCIRYTSEAAEQACVALSNLSRPLRQSCIKFLCFQITAGAVPLNKFVITKQLTKRPDDYPDAKSQPHVQVALRRKGAGKRDGVLPVSTTESCHSYLTVIDKAVPY